MNAGIRGGREGLYRVYKGLYRLFFAPSGAIFFLEGLYRVMKGLYRVWAENKGLYRVGLI